MPAFWLRIGDYSLRATIGVIRRGQLDKGDCVISLRQNRAVFNEAQVQFILGVFLFVVVVGLVDMRVPWPKARNLSPRS